MANLELLYLYNKLVESDRPEDIFGIKKDISQVEYISWLKNQCVFLINKSNPSYFSDVDDHFMANEVILLLNAFYYQGLRLIKDGNYGLNKSKVRIKKSSDQNSNLDNLIFNNLSKKIEMSFIHNDIKYDVFSNPKIEDRFSLYDGQRKINYKNSNSKNFNCGIEDICIKIINDKQDNDILMHEVNILKGLNHKSIPKYIDSFIIDDGRRVNIFKRNKDEISLYDLKSKLKNPVSQEHITWIFDRMLSLLGYLYSNDIIHCSIQPKNMIINISNCNCILTDYTLSIKDTLVANPENHMLNEFSAPELFDGSLPNISSDIYSLGKSILYFLEDENSNIPKNIDFMILEFLQEFVDDNPLKRPNNPLDAWYDLRNIRKYAFGLSNNFLKHELCENDILLNSK